MIKLDMGLDGGVRISEEDFIEELESKIEHFYGSKIRELVDEQIEEAITKREFELYKENIKLKDKLLSKNRKKG